MSLQLLVPIPAGSPAPTLSPNIPPTSLSTAPTLSHQVGLVLKLLAWWPGWAGVE